MLKKALPLVLMSGLVLTACNNNTVPNNNETPMEDRTRDITPDVNNGQTGPNMDGIDNDRDMNDNRVNNGVIDNANPNDVKVDENTTTGTEEIIIDENTTTPNGNVIDNDVNRKTTDQNNR